MEGGAGDGGTVFVAKLLKNMKIIAVVVSDYLVLGNGSQGVGEMVRGRQELGGENLSE